MEAEMSLFSLVTRASLLVQIVMLILLSASVLSWIVIVLKFKVLKLAREEAVRFEDQFWSGINLSDLYQQVKRKAENIGGIAKIFEAGFTEYVRTHKNKTNPEMMLASIQRSMKVAVAREEDRLDSHLSLLATIGSISPYIGLFGTVWGIMRSFIALGAVEHASLAMVAPGIAEALIATAMGLFAAIPAVIAYNRYAERVDRLSSTYENFAEEFATILQRQSNVAEEPAS
ncbi:Tol-Pal system protein TolQ [hydrothermal vent metagenome]|uniref:Tol-Pal system protein TolQ n=1 Tax=hydrothermal vent metagenome TaxID=652676 RepID=A0A3B0WEZ5_9ZZZZ